MVDTCEPSTRIFRVCANPFNTITDLDELNNCATKSIIFCEAPELYVKKIYFEPECAQLGEMIDIFAIVADTGEALASAILKFYYPDSPENNWSDTIFIASAGIDHTEAGDTTGDVASGIYFYELKDWRFLLRPKSWCY